MPRAEEFHLVTAHENETRCTALAVYIVPELLIAPPHYLAFGQKQLSKEDFAVGHVIVRLDGQNAVMGKPHAAFAVKERMAVGTAD